MKFALVADDGQGRVVVAESKFISELRFEAEAWSSSGARVRVTSKFHICRREPSANGENLVTIETWEKGVKL